MGSIYWVRILRVAGWFLVGVAGAAVMWRAAQRPVNDRADALTLSPKAGDYGPVRLSVVSFGHVAAAGGDTSIVFLTAGGPGTRGRHMLVGVPSLTAYTAGESQLSGATSTTAPAVPELTGRATMPLDVRASEGRLTEDKLSRRLTGSDVASTDPAVRAEMTELVALISDVGRDGLGTRVRHFRVVEARPWVKPWWLRRARWAYWVVLWALVAVWMWRGTGGGGSSAGA
jgi:hypothetical protein